MSKSRYGGGDRVSTKTRFATELVVLGRVLTTVRERSGLRQVEVAARLGLPASYLSKIESGTRRVDVIELLAICAAEAVDPADVIRELETALAAVLATQHGEDAS